jgi:hypothetical protein
VPERVRLAPDYSKEEEVTERKYTRAEFETELKAVRKWTDASYRSQSKETAESAERRLVQWFDAVQHDLGHVGALYENLKRVTGEKVAAEVRAEEAEQRVWHLERQLAAKRAEGDKEEEEDE